MCTRRCVWPVCWRITRGFIASVLAGRGMLPAKHPTLTVLDVFGYFCFFLFTTTQWHKQPAIIEEQQVDETTTDRNDNIFFLLYTRTLWKNGQSACKGEKRSPRKKSFFFLSPTLFITTTTAAAIAIGTRFIFFRLPKSPHLWLALRLAACDL